MPLYDTQLDDEVLSEGSVPISGVNNSLPPNAIDTTMAAEAENRLTLMDALNRPRPGLQRKQQQGTGLDSLNHYGGGQFLSNAGASWYHYDGRNDVLSGLTGGPNWTLGDQVYAALANTVLYFSRGNNLYKYDPAVGFGTVTLPAQYPTASYPIWAVNRLIYAWQNTIVCSDVLNPEYVDVITDTLTIDPIASDLITGLCLWQNQQIAIFRNGAVWLADSGPGLGVQDWTLNRISGEIGCRCHGTIVQCETDVYFLSETGRGVYALSQAPSSNQQGVWVPLSQDIQGYINRINWSACSNARAVHWRGLYLLSVPLDGVAWNNAILVYSIALGKWQGLWCFDMAGSDVGFRAFAVDETDVDSTVLLFGTLDGIISRLTYPTDEQYFDLNIDGSRDYFDSHLWTRSFTFSGTIAGGMAYGAVVNRIRPHSIRMQFLSSDDPVDCTVYGDRDLVLLERTVQTTGYYLQLPIPQLPFNLDVGGFSIAVLGLLSTGIYHELQLYMEGTGNWTLYQIKASAFQAPALFSQ